MPFICINFWKVPRDYSDGKRCSINKFEVNVINSSRPCCFAEFSDVTQYFCLQLDDDVLLRFID